MYEFDWNVIYDARHLLLKGMITTLEITGVAIVAGIILGTLLALARLNDSKTFLGKSIALLAKGYVNLFRSIPLIMVLLWFYLIVPGLLRNLLDDPTLDIRFLSALIGFTLFEAAFYSEIIRSGIQSIPKGQINASYALGFTKLQTMRIVVLPQAFRKMIPILLTQAIILFQDTSLVYVIGLSDFFSTAYKVGDRDGRLVELILFAGFVYFIICFIASKLVRRLSRKVRLS